MMKFIAVFLAIVYIVQADEWVRKSQGQMRAIHAECIAENAVSEENIAKMKHFEYSDVESVRKYIQCLAEKIGFLSIHEGFNIDRLTEQFKQNLPTAEAKAIMVGCVDKNEQGSPFDVWVFRTHRCFMASKVGQNAKEYIRASFA